MAVKGLYIERKTLLYKSKVEYAGWTINPFLGCRHGCKYPCYAMGMKWSWGQIRDYDDWINPRIVRNAPSLLERELSRMQTLPDEVFLCFSTDPFMFECPEVISMTMRLIKILNAYEVPVKTLTKGQYPSELASGEFLESNKHGITIVSLANSFSEEWEPFACPPSQRLETLRDLAEDGIYTWASLEPYPPPSLTDQSLEEILESLEFCREIVFGRWNYNGKMKDSKWEGFYGHCARTVISFCSERGIKYHIKSGTPKDGYYCKPKAIEKTVQASLDRHLSPQGLKDVREEGLILE